MNKINKLFLGILVVSLMITTASAATNLENHIAGVGPMAHPTSNTGIAGCSSCHSPIGSTTAAGFCTRCHSFPVFSLAVAANPTTVTANTSTSVSFAVNQTNTVNVTNKTAANGALVTLNGPGVSTSGTTSSSGIVAIPVTPTGAGTINALAEMTGFNNGTTTLTATTATPAPVLETITVAPPNITLSVGVTQTFTATARDQNGAPMEGINVEWTSSDMAVGNVSPAAAMTNANGTATTTFTAIANGTSMVNASNGSIMGSADVTVGKIVVTPVLTTITVSPPTATLSIGDTPVFTAKAMDQNGAPMAGINITWTSSNTSVGNVSPDDVMTDANGTATTTFTANAMGTAMVNATNGSVSGSAEVVVKEEIEEINLIKNPGFESGKQNWIFFTNGTGKFNITSPGFEGNNSAEIMLGKIGSNMQLYQKGITLKPNTHYKLSFAAKSSRGHDVRVVLLKHGSPFTNYGLKQNFNLTKDWQTFTTEFDTKGFAGTVDDGRLMFYLTPFAKAGDKYFFDSVVLEEETE